MTWDLRSAKVELRGYLNVSAARSGDPNSNLAQFPPDINYWLKPENTYRVVFIQVSSPKTLKLI